MGQVRLCHVQARQGDALKAAREKGIAGKGWQSRPKSHMLGCLDIDFCEWDAADIARQWRRLMRHEAGAEAEAEHSHSSDGTAPDGACTSAAACASGSPHPHDPSEALDIEEIARAARLKRKLVAIPDELLAELEQEEDSSEVAVEPVEEAAEPVEQVVSQERPVDVEDCRSYPSRLVREDGDMPLEEWTRKEADGTLPSGDYVVTAIVAERTRPGGRARQFLVKWKARRPSAEDSPPSTAYIILRTLWACKASG
ncbi:hypothetical protein CVIRNUC_006630 [Coccomyxa viridis]|uniref:Chromo domain-containing protein n=1 Tax=Coccomyxa viridis TaxID=1274662 RepID=A0AAV1I987_9CHLO|nr:hypothetical protein CVIRNUC_006630 [Coccomyxa viridis]